MFSLRKNDKGQMLMIAGIAITIGIITLGTITISLSNVSYPVDKKSYIKPEFDNVRKEFGVHLKDNYGDIYKYTHSSINLIFNNSKRLFCYVEALDGFYFNASIVDYYYVLHDIQVLFVKLTLIDDDEFIVEEVLYDFSSD